MNRQLNRGLGQISPEQAYEVIVKRLPEDAQHLNEHYLDYYAYPEVFGSTTGPFGGIGGQAMTTFTIEAWVCGKIAVLFCGDRILKVTDKWEGPMSVRIK